MSEKWDALRAHFDNVGLEAVELAVASGVPREVAGQRVAEFNDMLIERLRKRESSRE